MLSLPNGCRASELKVSPANWNKSTASTKKKWKIHYRFYDPQFPKPHQVVIKAGINQIKDLAERRAFVQKLIKTELEKLQDFGYNPITAKFVSPAKQIEEILPSTLFTAALEYAMSKLSVAHRTRIDVKSVVNGVTSAAKQLKIADLPVASIRRLHLKKILEQCGKNNSRWSARRYNMYRSYLLMLFKELVEVEAVVANPVRDISKMKETKKLRTVLTKEQRVKIDKHLKEVDIHFWLFVHLFFHSGSRLQELVQLKRSDVDLKKQTFKTLVKKGKSYKEIQRTIKDVALPFWEAFTKDAKSSDFLFGIDFLPSVKHMRPDTITRRWQKWVKNGLNIQVDLYSLKHLNTSEVVDFAGDHVAAHQNAHTSTAMVVTTYDVHRKERQHQLLRSIKNTFA